MIAVRLLIVAVLLLLALHGLAFADELPTSDETGDADRARAVLSPPELVRWCLSVAPQHAPSARLRRSEGLSAEVHCVADDLFDFDAMARRALGHHWKRLAPVQHGELLRLFTARVSRLFVTIVERYAGDLDALEEERTGPYARVRSRAIPTSAIAIEYRLFQSGSRWAVYDIVFDGMSLVGNYRSQFNSILASSSVTQLLQRMRAEAPPTRPGLGDTRATSTATDLDRTMRDPLIASLVLGAAWHRTRR